MAATKERLLCWAGHVARMSRTTVVVMAPNLLERGKRQTNGRSASETVQHLQIGIHGVSKDLQSLQECTWFCRICTAVDRMATHCSGSWAVAPVCENRKLLASTGGGRRRVVPTSGNEWLICSKGMDSTSFFGCGFVVVMNGDEWRRLVRGH